MDHYATPPRFARSKLHYTVLVLDFLLDIIFPRKCLGCGKMGKFICDTCQKTIRFYDPIVKHNIADVDDTFILAHYDGIIRQAIKDIKYRGTYGICEELGNLIRTNFHNKQSFSSNKHLTPDSQLSIVQFRFFPSRINCQ